jgi:hypothetical protein
MNAAELKAKLQARATALQTHRAELVARCDAQVAQLDTQLAAIRALAQNWDTYTVEQAITKLAETGLAMEIRS